METGICVFVFYCYKSVYSLTKRNGNSCYFERYKNVPDQVYSLTKRNGNSIALMMNIENGVGLQPN